jgi:zinc protease
MPTRGRSSRSFSPLQGVVTHHLPNGLRVLLKEDHAWPLLSVHAWVHVGSVDENAPQAGISHVLEHMVFKGTASYGAAEISRWVEALGGAMNAETSKEYTHYYIDIPRAGGQKAVSLLGELMHKARFDPAEWAREKPVILEELKRRNDDPESLLWDLLNETLFQEERLRRPVIGSEETVASITRDELWRFYHDFYRAGRSWIVIAGDFNPKQMLDWVQKAFGEMPRGTGAKRPPAAAVSYVPQHKTMKRPVQQSYAALGFPTPPSTNPDHEALDLLAAALGDGRSSRLVQTLREQQKLVWSVSAVNYGHEGPGIFSVFAECTPARRAQVRPAIEKIFSSLRRSPLTKEEVTRAKNMIQNAWLQGFETYHQQATNLGLYALDEQLDRLENYLPRILAITPSQLNQIADKYLGRLPLSTAVIEA